jgi:hypothetical protein
MRGPRVFFVIVLVSSFLVLQLAVGCSDPAPAPVCIDSGVDPACAPPYEPTWDALFANTLQPSCAKSGVSCHASTGRQGGINFDDREAAYAALLRRDVRAGEPECSPMVHRLVSTDGKFRMPPGANIDPAAQCAVVRWIAAGAKR